MIRKILEHLPQTDCGMCGMTCADFAGFLLSGDLSPQECPVLQEEAYSAQRADLAALLESLAARAKSGHLIDPEKCTLCGACYEACPLDAVRKV